MASASSTRSGGFEPIQLLLRLVQLALPPRDLGGATPGLRLFQIALTLRDLPLLLAQFLGKIGRQLGVRAMTRDLCKRPLEPSHPIPLASVCSLFQLCIDRVKLRPTERLRRLGCDSHR